MAEHYQLEAQARTVVGKKVGALRRQGVIPAVIYGAKFAPVHIQIPERPLIVTLFKAGGTHIIDMTIDGRPQRVLAREVQRHVVTGKILHVDFMAVDATTRIRATIPVTFVNDAPAEKLGVGVLLNGLTSIEIEALPENLVDHLDLDLSSLTEMGSSLHVRDLAVPGAVTLMSDPDAMIVRIAAQTVEEEPVTEVTAAEPEVIEKGKKEDEEES